MTYYTGEISDLKVSKYAIYVSSSGIRLEYGIYNIMITVGPLSNNGEDGGEGTRAIVQRLGSLLKMPEVAAP
jgi:hypothetical protein